MPVCSMNKAIYVPYNEFIAQKWDIRAMSSTDIEPVHANKRVCPSGWGVNGTFPNALQVLTAL
jgi:hypothetical protein